MHTYMHKQVAIHWNGELYPQFYTNFLISGSPDITVHFISKIMSFATSVKSQFVVAVFMTGILLQIFSDVLEICVLSTIRYDTLATDTQL